MVIIPDHEDDSYAKASLQAKTGSILAIEKGVWDRQGEFYDSYSVPAFVDLLEELETKYGFDEAMENSLTPDPSIVPDMRVFFASLAEDPRFVLAPCPNCAPTEPCDYV